MCAKNNATARSKVADEKAPASFGGTFDIAQLFNLLQVVKERWLWGLAAGLLASFVFAFVNLRQEPVYASEAYLQIESRMEQVIDFKQVVDTSLSGRGEAELENHLRQMQSRTFRNSVAESFSTEELRQLQAVYLLGNPTAIGPSAGSLVQRIKPFRSGQVFTIYATHHDSAAAALLANRFAVQYIKSIITRTGVGNESALVFLQQQGEEMRNKISRAEQALTDYRRRYNLVSLDDSQNIIVDRLKAINQEKTNARLQQLERESAVDQVETLSQAGQDLTEIPLIAGYGSIPEVLARKKAVEAELAAYNIRYLERHPRMIEGTQRLEQVAEQLEVEVKRAVRDLLNQKDAVDRRIILLVDELKTAEEDALALDQRAVEYNALKRQLDSDRQTFDSIINRLNETSLSSKLDTTNLRILDEAVPQYAPIAPLKSKILLVSLFLLGFGFIGVPLAMDLFDNRLKSVYDVEQSIGKPLLADLPLIPALESGAGNANYVLRAEDDELCEGFRSAYSSLYLQSLVSMPKSILVTSTRPGEGKSFVAANFGPTMAQHGQRCILVDTDLRRPVLHKHFDLRNNKGILAWHQAQQGVKGSDLPAVPVSELLRNEQLGITKIAENFDFLPAGGYTQRTSEVIDSVAFERLMSALKSEYDVVILDSPPVSLFTDALFLSEFVDEVIYVVRYNKVNRHKVRHFVNKLDGEQTKVVGLVINGRSSSSGQRYGYNYNYSYSAYSSDHKAYQSYSGSSSNG